MGCGSSKGVDVLNNKTESVKHQNRIGLNITDEKIKTSDNKEAERQQEQNESTEKVNSEKNNNKEAQRQQKQNEAVEELESQENTDSETKRQQEENKTVEKPELKKNADSETEQQQEQNEAVEKTESEKNHDRETERQQEENDVAKEIDSEENTDSETERQQEKNESTEEIESEKNTDSETEQKQEENESVEEIESEENTNSETERQQEENEATEEIDSEENTDKETVRQQKDKKAIEEIEPVRKNDKETERQHKENRVIKVKELEENKYKKIDDHARKAPEELKSSSADLVNYMASCTKDPEYLVRGFFIWISENIKYDVDGYFGKSEMASCDSRSVMESGKSVCEGYASVMEELCRQANIPVKKISGFAKGFRHTTEQVITEQTKTNHAWNAVQLAGKWYLLDSTWGSGCVNHSRKFEKRLEDYYFLTNPKHMISSHFPYMNNNMEESMKWQLLDKPVSLSDFSRRVKYQSSAFKIGARAVSHRDGLIEMKNELKMTFKSDGPDEINFSGTMMLLDGNCLREQRNATYGYLENGVFTMLVRPPKPGTYNLNIFGHPASTNTLQGIPQLLSYTVKCSEVKETDFEFPSTFATTGTEKVILREPMTGKLRANTEVLFKIWAPYLQTVKAGGTLLEQSGKCFTGVVKTGAPGQLMVYGNRAGPYDMMHGLFRFTVA